jgi:hypothetical protein
MHWTQDQAIAFEAAKECIGHWMAIHTGLIADESGKSAPDAAIITRLRARRSALAQERAGLRLTDAAGIARIRADYGANIRAWRDNTFTAGQSAP